MQQDVHCTSVSPPEIIGQLDALSENRLESDRKAVGWESSQMSCCQIAKSNNQAS